MALQDCMNCNKAYYENQERCPICNLTGLEAAFIANRRILKYGDAYWDAMKKRIVDEVMLKLYGTIGR